MLYFYSMTQKTNLDQPATKKDINGLRTEVKKTEKNLRGDMLKLEERMERVEEKVDRIDVVDGKLDRIQNTLDSFLGRVENLEKDNIVGAHHTRELRVAVDNHEKRIATLEFPNQ